jgi:hypothetical protein
MRFVALLLLPAVVIVIFNQTAYPEENDIVSQARQWFEWGDYLLIIQKVPEVISSRADSLDSAQLSQLHLYLGVAFFAAGKVGQARNEFVSALKIFPGITLDEKYVDPGISDLFSTCVKEYQQDKDLQEKNAQSLALAISTKNDSINNLLARNDAASKERNRRNPYMPVAIAMSVICAGFTGMTVYEYNEGEDIYQNFVQAAQAGDYLEYKHLKDKVQKKDNLTKYFCSAAGATLVISTFFYIGAYKNKVGHTLSPYHKVSVNCRGNSLNITIPF